MPEELKYYIERGRSRFFLETQKGKLGKGGMGDVLGIKTPEFLTGHVFKKYSKGKGEIGKELSKLRYLKDSKSLPRKSHLVWPTDIVYDSSDGAIVGFLMQKGGKETLEAYYARKLFKRENSFEALSIGYQIACSVDALHADNRFVHGDLKPQNFLIEHRESDVLHVDMIDMDNVQITEDGIHHRFSACTPEYMSPQFWNDEDAFRNGLKPISRSMDNFALAVILYKLFYGIHPFTGTRISSELRKNTGNTLKDRISQGLFPFGIWKGKCLPTPDFVDFSGFSPKPAITINQV